MDYNNKIDYAQILDNESEKYSLQSQLAEGINVNISDEAALFIRWMSSSDVSGIYDIEVNTFSDPWSVESFLYRLKERDYNLSIVGMVDNSIVAYAISYLVCDELHFSNIAVKKNFQRQRIAEILLWTSLQIGKQKNCRWVHLEVRESNNPAIQLYHKFGFKVVGVRKNYYQEDNEDALLMSKLL